MNLNKIKCPEGHPIGNITYKMEVGENLTDKRKLVRKIIEDIFYCQSCKKFYRHVMQEIEFTPKMKENKIK